MANTFKFGNGEWAVGKETALAYNDENSNFKPLPFTFDRASTATVVNKQGLIETVGIDEPRIDFLNNTKGHLLLEPERRNSITNSEEFGSTGWSFVTTGSAIAPIVSDNYAISPDGTQNAQRIQFDLGGGTTSSDRTIIRQNIATQNDWFLSVWMKSTDGTEQKILWHSTSDTNETVVTGEWKRFTFSRNGVSNSWAGLSLKGGVSDFDTADILVYGFQAEQGSYATSYIPTQGSAVTRSAETCEQTLPDGVIGQNEGVFYAEIKANETSDASDRRVISLSDKTNNNRVYISFDDEYNKLNIFIVVGGTSITQDNVNISNQNVYNKIAVKYKSGDSGVYVNGVLKNSFNDTFSGGAFNTLKFQNRGAGDIFNGNCKEIKVYNTALTDAELIALTS